MSAESTYAFICDVGESAGAGHAFRCIAIAEELKSRGIRSYLLTEDNDLEWVRDPIARSGLAEVRTRFGARELVLQLNRIQARIVVIDSYLIDQRIGHELRRAGFFVVYLVDSDTRGLEADVYLDQNPASTAPSGPRPPNSELLVGPKFALMRDSILECRAARQHRTQPPSRPARILAYFGGTDDTGMARFVHAALIATGLPLTATVVDPTLTAPLRMGAAAESAQEFLFRPPESAIPMLAAEADIVICAAGTSLLEQMCIGSAIVLVQTADNQESNYHFAVESLVAVGLGNSGSAQANPRSAAAAIRKLLVEPSEVLRLRRSAADLIDGNGRGRLVDAVAMRMNEGQ